MTDGNIVVFQRSFSLGNTHRVQQQPKQNHSSAAQPNRQRMVDHADQCDGGGKVGGSSGNFFSRMSVKQPLGIQHSRTHLCNYCPALHLPC